MNLLDIYEQREPYQLAIDALAQRRIEQLEDYIKNLKKALAQVKDAEQRQAIQDRIAAYEKERVDHTLGRTVHEAQPPQQPPAKGLLKGKDLVTPQQRVAGATPAKPGVAGAVKDVVGGVKRWLKGEPDQGPTYESVTEQDDIDKFGPPSGPLQEPTNQGETVYQQLITAYKSEVPYVIIPFLADEKAATLTKPSIFNALVALYKMNPNTRKRTIEKSFADFESFMLFVSRLKPYVYRKPKPDPQAAAQQPSPVPNPNPNAPAQTAPTAATPAATSASQSAPAAKAKWDPFGNDLTERKVQKKKSKDNDDIEASDIKVARELQKLRAKYPSARSDVEAVARAEIDSTERSEQQLAAIRGANEKQDTLLRQLVALDREQGQEIDGLDSELARVQATNAQLQKTLQGMTGTKKVTTAKKEPTTVSMPASYDVAPDDTEARERIAKLDQEIQSLRASAAAAPDAKTQQELEKKLQDVYAEYEKRMQSAQKRAQTKAATKAQAEPLEKELGGKRFKPVVPKKQIPTTRPVTRSSVQPPPIPGVKKTAAKKTQTVAEPDQFDLGNIFQGVPLKAAGRSRATMHEHGGGIGPRQHWQSLMREGAVKSAMYDYKIVSDEEFFNTYGMTKRQFYDTMVSAKKTVKKPAYKAPASCPQCGQSHEQCVCEGTAQQFGQAVRMAGYTGRELEKDPAYRKAAQHARQEREQSQQNLARVQAGYGEEPDEYRDLDESIKDAASATAVIACLLTGGSLSGCATAPQQTSAQQVLKTGQDIGRVAQTAKKITRAGTEEEVRQELRNILRGVSGRPEELNHSNILRIWRRVNQPDPQPQNEAKEPTNKQEYDRAVDSIMNQLSMERNSAVRQMLNAQLKVLQDQGRVHGWHKDRVIREDTAALAAEDAILKRIFVKHRDLMMEYGPDKITQAAEEVSYNVGDIAHITEEQVNEWVRQVEYILGARP